MRRLALAIAALAAAPALAQPPTDWTKPVTGVDAPAAATPQTVTQVVSLTHPSHAIAPETEEDLARRWEREQAIYAVRKLPDDAPVLAVTTADLATALDAATPLPPPCEPPLPRAPTEPPGPPAPAPAPCRP